MKERIRFEKELELLRTGGGKSGMNLPENYSGTTQALYSQAYQSEANSFDNEHFTLREHSAEWAAAYQRAAPENRAQTDLITQLALPILEKETQKQAQRVTALQILFANLDFNTAKRLYQRLTDSNDSLGKLFHLTLHKDSRKYLLSILDSVKFARKQPVDEPVKPPKPPNSGVPPFVPPKIDSTKLPTGKKPVPPPVKKPVPPPKPTKDPPINAPQVPAPWLPWKRPTYKLPDPDKSDWVTTSLQSAAGFLGLSISIGLRSLSRAALADAIEAAWIVFQIEQAPLRALYGMAGEAAAEAIFKHITGVDPSRIVNLNTIAANFPVLDFSIPTARGFRSVKVKGVAGKLKGKALEDAVRSGYVNDYINMVIADHPAAKTKLDKAVKLLSGNIRTLKRANALPTDLKDFSEKGIRRYIQEDSILQIPHNHVQMVKQTLGKDLAARIKGNKKILEQLGIRTDSQFADYVNSHIDRIESLGVKSTDLQILAETAAKHLPANQVERLRKELAKSKKK